MEHQLSSSSKVTVEYFDPYAVYQLLSPGLLPRLPLRNLSWEPLRSISSLHIDFVPSTLVLSSTDLSSTNTLNLSRVKSEDSVGSGDDGFRTQPTGQAAVERPESQSGFPKPQVKERRHQIPGLRQTPYLKVFFLRCDDNETYKTQARRQVREWIKQITPPENSKLNAQENHDAFEWLIVHVIVPNTAAATQPRTSGKSTEVISGSVTEKSAARWRGGGSSTILEKLRADFNSSSKSAADRVAQIRIGINDVPYDMLPRVVPAIPGSYTETTQENEAAWLDLVSKFKSLILASFDMRVSQYEEDIRERDSQRTLPGWNFCTFFVLKEGLARGFESVGLVQDALVGYDELSVGLDTIVREQSITGSGAEHGGSFLPYTEDLKREAERARAGALKEIGAELDSVEKTDPIDLQSTGETSDQEDTEIPLNIHKKPYRELILSNDISIFDFRCYIFARQLSLLLRLANASSSRDELLAKLKEQRESSLQGVATRFPLSQPSDDVEDLARLGEICKRSMDFVASIAIIMRDDIWASHMQTNHSQLSDEEKGDPQLRSDKVMCQIVDNVVSSFTFAIAQQILAQTSTKSLPIPPSALAPPTGIDGQEPKSAIPEPKTMMHPARSTSLAIRPSSREPPSPGIFPRGRRASLPDQVAVSSTFLKLGLEELSANRAELYGLSRSILEQVGRSRGWSVGWAMIPQLQYEKASNMEDVDLEGEAPEGTDKTSSPSMRLLSSHGIGNKLLRIAVDNRDDFYRLYETLTDKALRHYTVANHVQSMQARMVDLAVLKYHLADYAGASSYFSRMTRLYGEGGWAQAELSMLVMDAKCLKELKRKDEYVRVVLKLLSKSAMDEKENLLYPSAFNASRIKSFSHEEVEPAENYLEELVAITRTLQHEILVPLENFFGYAKVDDTPRYHPDKDTFALQLRLQYLLPENLNVEKARVKIIPITGDSGRETWLETDCPLVFKTRDVKLMVQSNVLIPGAYIVSQMNLFASNINFQYVHESSGPSFTKSDTFFKCPKLLIYHRTEAFDAKLLGSRSMHLDRNRSLEIELSSGWNDVISGELHIRAATAGLRLQTSESKVVSGSLDISKKSEAGVIHFGVMESSTKAKLSMPFSVEHEVNYISIKLEISYATSKGTFFFATTPSISIMLPLGVNVQDVFKHKALFSKFTISSATSSPLRLLSTKLENSGVFEAQCGLAPTSPVVIYPRQPACMLYKITKSATPISSPRHSSRKDSNASLSLEVHYICLEEEVDIAVTKSLHQSLQDFQLHEYTRLVVPAVLAELRARLTPFDLERTAILSEVSTSVLSVVKLRDHFSGLGFDVDRNQDIATLLIESLQKWQQKTPIIPLMPVPMDAANIAISRSVIIPVEVPSVTVVYTVDLTLLESSSFPGSTAVATSNQPVSASLTIKWTRIWDTKSRSENNETAQQETLEFVYEVSGPSENWLIGGRRKGHFSIPSRVQGQKEKLTFPLVLIPLREGYLPYPNVDIKPALTGRTSRPGTAAGEENGTRANQAIASTCETDYRNAGETIRVINNARKTTVSLDASGPQGGAWLLETEKRDAGAGGVLTG